MAFAPVSPEERDAALQLLSQTHDLLVAAISGLTEHQWRFVPPSGAWSIAQNVEHVTIVEESVQTRVVAALKTGPPPERDSKAGDAATLLQIVDRTTKLPAPERFAPKGDWNFAEAVRRFGEARRKSIEVAQNPVGFREHTVNHPFFGPLDGYQWMLMIAQHSARHTNQLEEVKQAPDFPQASAK